MDSLQVIPLILASTQASLKSMVNNLPQSQRVVNTHVQSDMMLKHGVGEWATTVKSGMVLYIHLVLCQKSLNTQTTNLQLVFHSDILIHVQL